MRTRFVCLFAILSAAWAQAAEIELNGHKFTLPDGFEIVVAAQSPIVERPITADFDDQGRLYVSDSSGTNDKVQQQLETKPHRILRLEDADGDGIFEKSHVFADKMMFPEGTMWFDGSLYVAAPPSIWKLTDTDDDGVADQREEWYQGKTLTGCANDLHGPYLAPDGWIYWCKGAFAEQTHIVNGKEWKTRASHVFRCRPDGSRIEPVMTGGMDNPVDVAFLPTGDRVLSNTFIVHPGNGQRDGLLHILYGGVYGKEQGALDGHPRTGELMPILSHMGPAAACGLTRYTSDQFGAEFRDNLFCSQFNKRMVSRHVLLPHGASYRSQDTDFVVSNNTDFHPTDVLEDADGSLLIVDTGGWYKLCCPSSQLHKPDVLGAIYRVRRRNVSPIADPRGKNIDWSALDQDGLVKLLTAPAPAVARRAERELARKLDQLSAGSPELQQLLALARDVHARSKQNNDRGTATGLVRAFHQLSAEPVRPAIWPWLDPTYPDEPSVCLAIGSVGLWRDAAALPQLVALLREGTPRMRRFAAEAIGRIGPKSAVPELLQAANRVEIPSAAEGQPAELDRVLEHSIVYALIEIGDASATSKGLVSENPRIQRAALIALDQMSAEGIDPEQVLARLDSAEPLLKETANWLISRHPEWGGALAGWFEQQLAEVRTDGDHADLEEILVRHARHPAIQEMLAKSLSSDTAHAASRALVLRVMSRSNPAETPAVWGEALAGVMAKRDASLVGPAVSTARALPAAKKPHAGLNAALIELAADPQTPAATRLDAMAAVQGGMPQLTAEQFQLLVKHLDPDQPVVERSSAAEAISKARLNADQLLQLADAIKTAGPLELDRLLAPYERSTDEQAGLRLLDALKKASALSSLRIDSLQQKLAKYSPAVQEALADVVVLVNVDAAAQKKELESRLAALQAGDIRRGQAVFNSAKAACTACHKFGYLGGLTGPDLTRIGGVRTERDLLESILFPSLSFVRSYEPVVIVTVDGRIINGLIRNETSTELLIATGPNQEVRVARDQIEEVRPSTVSIMPAGLDKQLTPQELADLVAFLKNAK